MDHYCPFVLTCVGHANHKAFFLFCTYQSLAIAWGFVAASKWMWTCFLPFIWSFHMVLCPFIGMIILLDFLATFSFLIFAAGMSISHLYYLLENMTTLDDLSSSTVRNVGNLRSRYNLGVLYSLKNVGFANTLSWWFPFAHRDKYEGYVHNKAGESREYFAINKEFKTKCVKDGKMEDIEDNEDIIKIA
jgi:DHHC palmitoyltransferase